MTDSIADRLWQFQDKAEEATRVETLTSQFLELTGDYGVKYASVTLIQGNNLDVIDGYGSFDWNWTEVYTENSFFDYDPIFISARHHKQFGYWSHMVENMTLTQEQQMVLDGARQYNICDGVTRLFYSQSGLMLLLTMQGDELDQSPEAKRLFHRGGLAFVEEGCRLLDRPQFLGPGKNILTSKQQLVVDRISRGLSHKEIANELDMAPRTVEVHSRNLRERLGVKTMEAAVAEAVRRGAI